MQVWGQFAWLMGFVTPRVERLFVPTCRKWGVFEGLRPNLDGCRPRRVAFGLLRDVRNSSSNDTPGDAYVARPCPTRTRRGTQARSRRISRDARIAAVGAAGTTAMGPGCRTMRGTARRSGRCQVSIQDARRGFHEGRTRHDGTSSPASSRPNSRRLMRRLLRLKACQPAGPLVLPKSR